MGTVTRVKKRDPNPDNLMDGEMLPCIGGPLDGEMRKVELLFGVMPNAGFSHEKNHFYRRDGRTYIHCDPKVNRYAHLGLTKPQSLGHAAVPHRFNSACAGGDVAAPPSGEQHE